MKPLIVHDGQAGMTLLAFLRESLENYPSVKAIKRAIDHKQCTINGRVELFSTHRVRSGDQVEITLDLPRLEKAQVLFEDEHLIAFNKPPGKTSESFSPYLLVHRLDKDTSGVLLLAKTSEAQEAITDLFRQRKMDKAYLAICDGTPEHDEWKIDNYLAAKVRYQGGALYGKSTKEKGKRAITQFKVLKRESGATLILVKPLTGRTHQIRVHLKEFGYPVLGDFQYAKNFTCSCKPRRQMLHALRLSFIHPYSGKKMIIEAPLLKDFLQVQKSLFPS